MPFFPPKTRGLPPSGQTGSYLAGDDGAYHKGWVGTRWTDNSDGTATDNATGLTWVRAPALIFPGVAGVLPNNQINPAANGRAAWTAGNDYVVGDIVSDDAGVTSTVYTVTAATAANPPVFTTIAPITDLYPGQQLWFAGFNGGSWGAINTSNWSAGFKYCYCLRSASSFAGSTSATGSISASGYGAYSAGSGTVWGRKFYVCVKNHHATDLAAQLAENWVETRWNNNACAGVNDLLYSKATDLYTAVGMAESLVYAGHSDWRLPNIMELFSTMFFGEDATCYTPALLAQEGMSYWSTTNCVYMSNRVMTLSTGGTSSMGASAWGDVAGSGGRFYSANPSSTTPYWQRMRIVRG